MYLRRKIDVYLKEWKQDAHRDPGNTLLFFDELQDFPEITTALKFFGCAVGNFVKFTSIELILHCKSHIL